MASEPVKTVSMARLLRMAKEKAQQESIEISEAEEGYPQDKGVDIQRPSSIKSGYPHRANVDILPSVVDSKISTFTEPVDIKISTNSNSGYPKNEDTNIHKPKKKDRHGGNKTSFFTRIDPAVAQQIALFCTQKGIDKQDFVELAAIHFIESADIHKSGDVDILISHDDRRKMMLWKTSSTIINLYLKYLPENRWKPRDDREAERYNAVDIRLVELGILTALLRTEHKKIHSFKYFVDEIEENIAVPLESSTIDIMLKRRREQLSIRREAE